MVQRSCDIVIVVVTGCDGDVMVATKFDDSSKVIVKVEWGW